MCNCYVLVYESFMSFSLNSKLFINSSSLTHNILPQGLRGSKNVVSKSVILKNVTSFSKNFKLIYITWDHKSQLVWNFWSGEMMMWFKYEKLIKTWCFEPKNKYMLFPMCQTLSYINAHIGGKNGLCKRILASHMSASQSWLMNWRNTIVLNRMD